MPSGYVPRKTYPLVGGCVLRRVQASSIRGQFKRSKVGENRSSETFSLALNRTTRTPEKYQD